MFGRNKLAMMLAEFFGTAFLTLVVLSVQRSTVGVPYFVALAAGLTVTVMLFALGRVSGAYLNPALTLGMWTARKLTTARAAVYIVLQLLGAWAAYGLYTYFVNSSLPEIGGTFNAHVMVAELVGAFIFSFAWAAATYRGLDHGLFGSTAGIGFALGLIVAASAGIGLINPALALGTRAWMIWTQTGWLNYVLGPVLGAVAGVNLYALFMAPERALVPARATNTTATTTTTTRPAATTVTTKKAAPAKTTRTSKTNARKKR